MSTHDPIVHGYHVVELPPFILILPFFMATIFYLFSVVISNRKHKKWPVSRTVCWLIGICSVGLALAGPLAEKANEDFTVHMIGHILLGMLGPLLLVLAAPMTLFLRTLDVRVARRLTKLLNSMPMRVVMDPVMASLLNVGGLWLLYTTNLWTSMHENSMIHVLVHFHVFLAGYVFTQSMIYIDPTPHRTSYRYRSIMLVIALAGHGILSKYIYAHPPMGVSPLQAEIGAMIMYYGGDMIEVILIYILCRQWYKAGRPLGARRVTPNPNH